MLCAWGIGIVGLVAGLAAATAETGRDAAESAGATAPSRVISASRQFIVYADDPRVAATMAAYAEHIKRQWLASLQTNDVWRDVIVMVVHSRSSGLAPRVQTIQSDVHLRFHVDCPLPLPAEHLIRATVVEALCAELANRAEPTYRGVPYAAAPLPRWLVSGLAEDLGDPDDELLGCARRLVATTRWQPAAAFVTEDGGARATADASEFRAQAWLWTASLRALPEGAAKMRRFLTELGVQKSIPGAFWTVYGDEFADKARVEKWWALALLDRVNTIIPQNLTPEETDERLTGLLRVHLREPATGPAVRRYVRPLSDLTDYATSPWMKDLAQERLVRLDLLTQQAHPLYWNAFRVYRQALHCLVQQQPDWARRFFEQAELYRQQAVQRTAAIRRYLDQFDE